ncbi:hypothetical protein [Lysinibacillus pakistanensis]
MGKRENELIMSVHDQFIQELRIICDQRTYAGFNDYVFKTCFYWVYT